MGLFYRLENYAKYRALVGEATYIDITRRADPARIPQVWKNLQEVVDTYGPPWVVQLWTKDIAGALHLGEGLLRSLISQGTTITAQITVTGLAGTPFEPLVPPNVLTQVPRLAALIGGPDHIKWRYDPIIPGVHTTERFWQLAQEASRMGITQGVINFIAPPGRYKRVDRRLARLLPGWAEGMPGYNREWMKAVAKELVALAAQVGITLACCAESAFLAQEVKGLRPAACGDYAWFVTLSGRDPGRVPFKGSRPGCGCAHYFDVGNYGWWARCHRCAYCYAG